MSENSSAAKRGAMSVFPLLLLLLLLLLTCGAIPDHRPALLRDRFRPLRTQRQGNICPHLQKPVCLFVHFSHVCPEPVLANIRFVQKIVPKRLFFALTPTGTLTL